MNKIHLEDPGINNISVVRYKELTKNEFEEIKKAIAQNWQNLNHLNERFLEILTTGWKGDIRMEMLKGYKNQLIEQAKEQAKNFKKKF